MTRTLIICALSGPLLAAEAPPKPERRNPFAGHNCYSDDGVKQSKRRLAMVLRAGLRFIEVDVNHHRSAGGFVVTHKSEQPPAEPRLADFLRPLWRRWRAEPGEHLLIIDLKAGRPDLVARDMHQYLLKYREALCTFAPDGSARSRGPISVCLTGSSLLGQAYINLASRKGELLARRDTGFSGQDVRDALRRMLQRAPQPGVAYLTLNWNVVADGSKTPGDTMDRLCEIVAGARRHDYGLRIYTLNVPRPKRRSGRLVSGEWDARWRACVRAGVDMISTDNYALAAEWWEQIGCKLDTIRTTPNPAGRRR